MTTPTVTEAGAIAYGREILARATSLQWPASVRMAFVAYAADLRDALETYDAIRAGDIHPASEYCDEYADLRDEPEAQHVAEGLAAGAVRDLADEMARRFPVLGASGEGSEQDAA